MRWLRNEAILRQRKSEWVLYTAEQVTIDDAQLTFWAKSAATSSVISSSRTGRTTIGDLFPLVKFYTVHPGCAVCDNYSY